MMPEREDIVEIQGIRIIRPVNARSDDQSDAAASARGKFLSVWFRCCNVYGRMNRNKDQTAYEGRCPRCGAAVRASIGPGGTSQRMFEAS